MQNQSPKSPWKNNFSKHETSGDYIVKDGLEEVCDDNSVNDESTKGESIGVVFSSFLNVMIGMQIEICMKSWR